MTQFSRLFIGITANEPDGILVPSSEVKNMMHVLQRLQVPETGPPTKEAQGYVLKARQQITTQVIAKAPDGPLLPYREVRSIRHVIQ